MWVLSAAVAVLACSAWLRPGQAQQFIVFSGDGGSLVLGTLLMRSAGCAMNDWADRDLMLGWARARGFKPIVRCAATCVDPATGRKDQDVTKALFDHYGHMFCGIYLNVTQGGAVREGDTVAAG